MRDEGDTDGSGDGDLALVKGQRRVLELVATGAPVGDTLDAVVGLVEARNPRLRCVVLVVNDDGTHFSRASGPSLPEDYRRVVEHLAITPPYLGSCGEAAHGGMPVAVPDVAADTRYPAAWRDLLARHGAASILSTPVRGRDGRVLASFAVLHDGSCAVCPHLVEVATSLLAIALQRRRDDDALQTQAARLQAVIETVPAAIWFTDARDGSAVVGNAEAARLVRMAQSANHSLTAPWPERPTHFRVLRDGVEIAPEMLAMQRAARGEEVAAEEQEIAFADGSWAIIDVRATPLRDAAGAVVGAVCAALDITERKRADMALRRSEEEFRALGEHLPNPCWMADANGWIYWYSRGWYRLHRHDASRDGRLGLAVGARSGRAAGGDAALDRLGRGRRGVRDDLSAARRRWRVPAVPDPCRAGARRGRQRHALVRQQCGRERPAGKRGSAAGQRGGVTEP